MEWATTMERHGWVTAQYGDEPFTPFSSMVSQCKASGTPTARVAMTVGASEEYGAVKVSCTVSLECPQSESAINLAGDVAFQKARELVNDGASHLQMRQLP